MNLTKLIPAVGFVKDLVRTIKNSDVKDALAEAEEGRGIERTKGMGVRDRIRALGAASEAGGGATGMKRGGPVKKPSRKAAGGMTKKYAKGGSASKRADGIAKKGKTRGKMV